MARFSPNTVSDRTPLDSLAYTRYQEQFVWGDVFTPEQRHFYMTVNEDFVVGHMHKYDLVFYFPPLWAPKVDAVRDGDTNYQLMIDESIKFLLGEYGISYEVMPEGSVKERVDYVASKIT